MYSDALKSNVSVSVNGIHAIGTVTHNFNDGKRLKVQWEEVYNKPREWYFLTYRNTIDKIDIKKRDNGLKDRRDLVDFVFNGKEQDFNMFSNR